MMNRIEYNTHLTRITKHISFLKQTIDFIEFCGPGGVDYGKFLRTLNSYKDELRKYLSQRRLIKAAYKLNISIGNNL
jgi:hypothetical protein